eukprot:GHVO01045642.1.p1 GENE.GHVO01045642.1~~GHVO01045642.1.p1  ORF type:complete len:527 (+),score=123.62 GHVO01045642.1:182-1582(+)
MGASPFPPSPLSTPFHCIVDPMQWTTFRRIHATEIDEMERQISAVKTHHREFRWHALDHRLRPRLLSDFLTPPPPEAQGCQTLWDAWTFCRSLPIEGGSPSVIIPPSVTAKYRFGTATDIAYLFCTLLRVLRIPSFTCVGTTWSDEIGTWVLSLLPKRNMECRIVFWDMIRGRVCLFPPRNSLNIDDRILGAIFGTPDFEASASLESDLQGLINDQRTKRGLPFAAGTVHVSQSVDHVPIKSLEVIVGSDAMYFNIQPYTGSVVDENIHALFMSVTRFEIWDAEYWYKFQRPSITPPHKIEPLLVWDPPKESLGVLSRQITDSLCRKIAIKRHSISRTLTTNYNNDRGLEVSVMGGLKIACGLLFDKSGRDALEEWQTKLLHRVPNHHRMRWGFLMFQPLTDCTSLSNAVWDSLIFLGDRRRGGSFKLRAMAIPHMNGHVSVSVFGMCIGPVQGYELRMAQSAIAP